MTTKKIDDFSCSTLKEQNKNTNDVDSVIYGVDTGPDDIHHTACQKFTLFKDFTLSGLGRLGSGSVEDTSLLEIWKDVQPFSVGFIRTPVFIIYLVIVLFKVLIIFTYLFVVNRSEIICYLFCLCLT